MKRIVWLTVVLAIFVTGFGAAAQSDTLTIVASFSILADVVNNVTLGQADVISLIPIGADPHGYEPSARDLAALSEADIIFVAGGGFEEQLLDAIAGSASDVPVVEASACVYAREFGDDADHEHADEDHDDVHGDETDSHGDHTILGLDVHELCESYELMLAEVDAQKESMGFPSLRATDESHSGHFFEADCSHADHDDGEEEDHSHAHGACDPHVWSDPRNVILWSLFIGDVLGALNPGSAEQYNANATEYAYAIEDLLRLQLEPELAQIAPPDRLLLTNHETLGYFAAAYGFEITGFVMPGGSALAEPSARDLAGLIELVRSSGVKAIFVETTVASRVAEQVAAETGIPIVPLYTDSLSDVGGPAATYLDYIAYNFTTIADALAP